MRTHGIWIVDLEGRTAYVNSRMADMLDTTPSDMTDQPYLKYFRAEDVDAAKGLFEGDDLLNAKSIRVRLRRRDGSTVWVAIIGVPMHNATGTLLGTVGTVSLAPPVEETPTDSRNFRPTLWQLNPFKRRQPGRG